MAGISSVENNKNVKWNEGERRSKYMKINLSASSSVNNIEIITKNPTSENCFAFNSTTGEITQYYYYENNDNTQPSCPMDVIIPSSVTSIGNSAFSNNNLSSLTLEDTVSNPSQLEVIGPSAFASNELTSVTIPSSVTSIESGAFNNNQLPDSQAYIYDRTDTNSDGIAEIDYTTIISYGGAKRSNVIIPQTTNSVDLLTIEVYSFAYNDITSVTIPSSVTFIEGYAFYDNVLTSVTFLGTTPTIGCDAFYGENHSTEVNALDDDAMCR